MFKSIIQAGIILNDIQLSMHLKKWLCQSKISFVYENDKLLKTFN